LAGGVRWLFGSQRDRRRLADPALSRLSKDQRRRVAALVRSGRSSPDPVEAEAVLALASTYSWGPTLFAAVAAAVGIGAVIEMLSVGHASLLPVLLALGGVASLYEVLSAFVRVPRAKRAAGASREVLQRPE
jgi:hypothetical protein